ncbi:MAG: peptidoglycan-binding protein [Stenomitos rutilans HA7619-LM2]|jgi:peptidoglycan hydrolase-like protein with peptidoglycan-binding domain|nr:peptidoglycan-binding protein [Stenomitos rutilans HA7619-LM2]
METFAYLHTACAYEDPEATDLALSFDRFNVKQLSGQASLLMLQLLVPAAILAVAGHASALQVGDRGPSVTTLQNRLRSAGYFNRSSTGVYSTLTESAVRRFQASRGLAVDGVAGPATQRALRGQPYAVSGSNYRPISYSGGLRRGSTGADVRAIQQQLRNLGYDITVDGVFGSATDRAVRSFQASNGLSADGIVGSATRSALSNGTNIGYPSPSVDPGNPSYSNGDYISPIANRPVAGVNNRYVVVVPAKSSTTLWQVQRFEPRAVYTSSNLGRYVWAGAFAEKGIAEARAALLRANRLDAQVRYF